MLTGQFNKRQTKPLETGTLLGHPTSAYVTLKPPSVTEILWRIGATYCEIVLSSSGLVWADNTVLHPNIAVGAARPDPFAQVGIHVM